MVFKFNTVDLNLNERVICEICKVFQVITEGFYQAVDNVEIMGKRKTFVLMTFRSNFRAVKNLSSM